MGPSKRTVILLAVEYDELTNPDEVAEIQARTALPYEGVIGARARAMTPERARAVWTLLQGDRSPEHEFLNVTGKVGPEHKCNPECKDAYPEIH